MKLPKLMVCSDLKQMLRQIFIYIAHCAGFADKGELWKSDYETEDFEEYLDKLWKQVEPLYDALHKFVRNKLKERYGDKIDISDGLIPAHVVGGFRSNLVEFSSSLDRMVYKI